MIRNIFFNFPLFMDITAFILINMLALHHTQLVHV